MGLPDHSGLLAIVGIASFCATFGRKPLQLLDQLRQGFVLYQNVAAFLGDDQQARGIALYKQCRLRAGAFNVWLPDHCLQGAGHGVGYGGLANCGKAPM